MDFALAGSNRLIESVDGIVILEIERDPRRMELAEKSGRISLWESKTTGERVLYLTIRGTPELSYHGYETDVRRGYFPVRSRLQASRRRSCANARRPRMRSAPSR